MGVFMRQRFKLTAKPGRAGDHTRPFPLGGFETGVVSIGVAHHDEITLDCIGGKTTQLSAAHAGDEGEQYCKVYPPLAVHCCIAKEAGHLIF